MANPKGYEKLRDRVQELSSKRQSGKKVERTIVELTPVIRGWRNDFRTGNADRGATTGMSEAGSGRRSVLHSPNVHV